MKISIILTLSISFMIFACKNEKGNFKPGNVWLDTEGNQINAHAAGILYDKGTYYWFGEYKKGKTRKVDYIKDWECYRVDAGGISCYSSQDLVNWKNEGIALSPVKNDSLHDLHISKVIERPKVVYNEKTKKYIMWMHVDSEDYSYSRAGVAISDKATGPYTYVGSMRPNGNMSRDMTLFKDDDGKAYHIYSSENNATMHISLLNDDYLQPSGKYIRVFEGQYREAPSIVKSNNKYYLISSGCTGWAPNEAMFAVSDSMLGNWNLVNNPCKGKDADKTYYAQSTFILPVQGKDNTFIFLADKWNKTNLEDSRYIWLPLTIKDGNPVIEWKEQWRPLEE